MSVEEAVRQILAGTCIALVLALVYVFWRGPKPPRGS